VTASHDIRTTPTTDGKEINMQRHDSTWAIVVALALMLAGLAVAASAQSTPQLIEVRIDNFSFGPTEVTVMAGTTVTWTNHDDIPHTVVSTDKVFKSKVLDTDEKFSFTFTTAGTYSYFCSIHPKMTGRVIVR
jgi:plastocyanin